VDTKIGLGISHREGKGTIALFVTRGVRAPSSTVSWRPPRPRLRFPALCNPPLSVHPIRNPECFLLSPKIMTQKAKNPVEIKEVSDWGHPPVGKHPRPHLSQLFIGRLNTHLEARREKYVLPHLHFFKESTTFSPHFAAIIFLESRFANVANINHSEIIHALKTRLVINSHLCHTLHPCR